MGPPRLLHKWARNGAGGKREPWWGWGGGRTALLGPSFRRWAPVCSGVVAEASLAETGSRHVGVKASRCRVHPGWWAAAWGTGGHPQVGRRNLPQDLISLTREARGTQPPATAETKIWVRTAGPVAHRHTLDGPSQTPAECEQPTCLRFTWTLLGGGTRECHPNTTLFPFPKPQGSFPSESGGRVGDCVALGDSALGRARPVQAWRETGWLVQRGERGEGGPGAGEAARPAAHAWAPRISPWPRGHPPVR